MTRPGRALLAGLIGLVVVLIMGSCAGLDLISKDEQANRLQAAAAFGALSEDIRIVAGKDYPGSDNLTNVASWLTDSSDALTVTDERFGVWTNVTAQLTFVPDDSPGPTREMIGAFDIAFVAWTTTASAFQRSVRKCLKNKKPKVAKKCLETAQVSSVPDRTATDAALATQVTMIQRSLTNASATASEAPSSSVSVG
jgi:uncharacterized membrane protein